MKRPLVPVALCYGAGLLLAEFYPLPYATWIGWSLVLLVTALAWTRRRPIWLGVVVACGGDHRVADAGAFAADLRLVAAPTPTGPSSPGILRDTTVRGLMRRAPKVSARGGSPAPLLDGATVPCAAR
jgi:hypothetical protein